MISSKRPLYSQLKDDLIRMITTGALLPGAQLPSQRSLCETYQLSHMTVRRVINELIGEGVVYSLPGKGLYVAEPKQEAEPGPLVSFSEAMARRGMLVSNRLLETSVIGASTLLAAVFNVEVGTALVHLRRLRLADGEPIAIQTTYLLHALCPGLRDHLTAEGSLYTLLRDTYGLHFASGVTTVEARLADSEVASLLGISPSAPLLVTEQITRTDHGQVAEFTRSLYRGDRYRMTVAS